MKSIITLMLDKLDDRNNPDYTLCDMYFEKNIPDKLLIFRDELATRLDDQMIIPLVIKLAPGYYRR
jgi:hypothetical protein